MKAKMIMVMLMVKMMMKMRNVVNCCAVWWSLHTTSFWPAITLLNGYYIVTILSRCCHLSYFLRHHLLCKDQMVNFTLHNKIHFFPFRGLFPVPGNLCLGSWLSFVLIPLLVTCRPSFYYKQRLSHGRERPSPTPTCWRLPAKAFATTSNPTLVPLSGALCHSGA